MKDRLSAYSLTRRSFSPRVIKLLTEGPQVGESMLDRQARDVARYLVQEHSLGHQIVENLTTPEAIKALSDALLGVRKG